MSRPLDSNCLSCLSETRLGLGKTDSDARDPWPVLGSDNNTCYETSLILRKRFTVNKGFFDVCP
jgi:hypothetical protein